MLLIVVIENFEWENDDELSIALLAFNEAINHYDLTSEKKFKNYSRMLIKSRLIDFFRKESRHHLPSEGSNDDETEQVEIKAAYCEYKNKRLHKNETI
ncbi:sigma factor [Natranaerobius trueperi]|uniref:Uncharacterized protein n=1 Tax=Natranaerobius trueperi TaxID=759412 RepID=A0A226BZA8_9FIRM|nr:sigma factor [Natranaerobius trueperi]OWZ84378.1 hypothetical protein CDO51_03705 [Natranaerobius trueperi]